MLESDRCKRVASVEPRDGLVAKNVVSAIQASQLTPGDVAKTVAGERRRLSPAWAAVGIIGPSATAKTAYARIELNMSQRSKPPLPRGPRRQSFAIATRA